MNPKHPTKKPIKAKARTKPKKVKRRPVGRPSEYSTKMVEKILALAATGHIESDIAAKVGISRTTLTNWKDTYPEFLAALKKAKENVDDLVEKALLMRAKGFTHKELKVRERNGKKFTTEETMYFAPDTTAQIFWLKNRRRKDWADVQRRELSGPNGETLSFVPPQIIITIPANGREAPEERKPEEPKQITED